MFAAALVALASVGALPIPAAGQAPREARRGAPHVLKPVESSAGVALVQVRAYCLEAGGNTPIVYVPDDEEKTRGSAEGKRLQRSLRPGAARAAAKALPFSAALPDMLGDLGQDRKLIPVSVDKLGQGPAIRPAEQVLPVRMAVIAASFPYKAQVEEFRAKLRLPSAAAVLEERDADGLPTFRFLGVRVERRTLGADGKPLTPWAEVDVAAAYKPYLLLTGQRFEPEEPPALERVIFPGLVMPKLLAFRPHQYLPVEMRLKTLRKAMEQAPNSLPAAPAVVDVPPGIAKPRPDPLPPAVAKPRKAPAAKAPPAADPSAALLPDYCLLRVIDVTVQPGKVYQYRLRVRMANPNYGRKNVASPKLARDREIGSE
jgi:hypothetical protein